MQHKPLISCVCLSHKRPELLRNAIKCFNAQTYTNKELIIVGHEDDEASKNVVQSFISGNIKYLIAPKKTRGELRNFAIEQSAGEYFCQWDDDDWCHCKRLEAQYTLMEENGKLSSVLIYSLLYDAVNNEAYLSSPLMDGRSILCDKSIFDLGIRYEHKGVHEDVEFMMRLRTFNYIMPVVMPVLYAYVYHGSNTMNSRYFKELFQSSQKLSPATARILKDAISGKLSNHESSALISNPNLLSELDYMWNTRVVENKLSETHYGILEKLSSGTVLNGPFKGLVYPGVESVGSTIIPKLIGCYEHELEPVVSEVIHNSYETIINIGCGEGYYANGLAVKCAQSRVYAYDTDPKARKLCLEMAKINGVEKRVLVEEKCTMEILRDFAFTGRSLIICDCEGFELQLFTPDNLSNISKCDLLIETHDFIDITISTRLAGLFRDTHSLTVIQSMDDNQKAKTYSFYPFQDVTDLRLRRFIYMEERPCTMEWLWLKAKDN